jgi:hypothetical protein
MSSTLVCPHCKCPLAGSIAEGDDGRVCPFCGKSIMNVVADGVREGEIIGWRGVMIRGGTDADQSRPRIWSPVCPIMWAPGATMEATCHGVPLARCPHRLAGDKAPHAGCSCGFYAGRTREHLMNMGYQTYSTPDNPDHVLCEVAQWGRVMVASNGFRAQNVRLLRIYVPSDGSAWRIATMLDEDYGKHGTEIVLADTLNKIVGKVPEWCEACYSRMKRPGVQGNEDTLRCKFCGHVNTPTEV